MEKYNTLKNKKDFNTFLLNKKIYLTRLTQNIYKEQLVFDENELKEVSNYFINKNDKESFNNTDKLIFVTYLGEYIIHNYGGEWFFTGCKDDFSPNEPCIGNSKVTLIRECPSNSVYNILITRDENYFYEKLNSNVKKMKEVDTLFSQLFPKKQKK